MTTRKETVRVCDVCKKKVSDGGELHIGGHPHTDWFTVEQTSGSTQLDELKKRRDWDLCSIACLQKLANDVRKYQSRK